jgi:hypothetical protein
VGWVLPGEGKWLRSASGRLLSAAVTGRKGLAEIRIRELSLHDGTRQGRDWGGDSASDQREFGGSIEWLADRLRLAKHALVKFHPQRDELPRTWRIERRAAIIRVCVAPVSPRSHPVLLPSADEYPRGQVGDYFG